MIVFYFQYFLIFVGVVIGYELATRLLIFRGLSNRKTNVIVMTVILIGAAGAWMLPYVINKVVMVSSLGRQLKFQTGGFSSIFGMISATITLGWFLWRDTTLKDQKWKILGALAFVFPFAWIPPRLSCALFHYHLGNGVSNKLFAIFTHEGLLDLGRVEFILTLITLIIFLAVKMRTKKNEYQFALEDKFYVIFLLAAFGSFRVLTDRFRNDVIPITENIYPSEIAGFAAVITAVSIALHALYLSYRKQISQK